MYLVFRLDIEFDFLARQGTYSVNKTLVSLGVGIEGGRGPDLMFMVVLEVCLVVRVFGWWKVWWMLQRIIDASGGAESWRFHEEEVMLDTYQNRYTNLIQDCVLWIQH
jgi:hypothetical protein